MAKVFVPLIDNELEGKTERGVPLVPYHPDRPCWRLDPVPRERSRPLAQRVASEGDTARPNCLRKS